MNWQAVVLTSKLASLTACILMLAGVPVALWLVFSPRRWKFLVEALVGMPLVLPPTVLGFYLLVLFGSSTPFGRWYRTLTGSTLAFSFSGLLVASVLYSFPFAVNPIAAAVRGVDARLIDAAHTLGAGKWKTYGKVVLPIAWPGLLTALVMSFAHTVGEFGVVLMVGGNIPGVTRTLSIDIYDRVQALDYGSANQTALALLVFSYALLCLVYLLNHRPVVWSGR